MKLHDIYHHFLSHEEAIQSFFEAEFKKTPPLFYLSCDLRNSGNKISVIDTNLYPAGFNNLCKAFTKQAVSGFRDYLNRYYPAAKRILVFAEAHTRNKFYFENLLRLTEILKQSGFEIRVGTSSADFAEDPTLVSLNEGKTLDLYRLKRSNDQVLSSEGWIADLILSNNDFSSGIEPLLENLSQPVVPPLELGWYRRRKSDHFEIYNQIAAELGNLIDLDPWLISCITAVEKEIDVSELASIERLAQSVDQVILQIQKKYAQYKIETPPYVFVKNNSGTYGMAVTYFSSGQEILNMNRKTRQKMTASKGGGKVSEYLIQEGIATADFYSGYPIEPVIYMAGQKPIGGFFRLNEEKDEWSSLNTKGMAFSCLCLHKLDEPHEGPFLRCLEKETLVKMSFIIAQIASLAAAREGFKL